ncbi:hypothetical protein HDU76_007729 [Blyttiomyces sp. JEL0837]|nr:hypothetical protein HDU76_007729 [Blyttiomyces sp. JEL0837]
MSANNAAELTVSELAAERNAQKGGEDAPKLPAVPIWLVLVITFVASISAIIAPLAVTLMTNSHDALNTITTIALQRAVTEAAQGVEDKMSSTVHTLENFMNNTYATADYLNHISNLRSSSAVFQTMLTTVASEPYYSAFVCSTPGSTVRGPFGYYTNRTSAQAGFFPVKGANTPTIILRATNKVASIYTNSTNGTITRVTPDQSPVREVALLGNGLLAQYGSYGNLESQTPDLSKSSNAWLNIIQRNLDDGQPWYMSAAQFTVKNISFTLVVGFPRADLFANVDRAEKNGIIVACVIAVVGVIFTVAIIYLSLRPLHRLCVNMKELTKFDFSSLEQGGKQRYSILAEIREIETVYLTMVLAFASALKRNKALTGGVGQRTTSRGHYYILPCPLEKETCRKQ